MLLCTALTSIDLGPFAQRVTEVGSCFLKGCSSLTAIDLSPLRKVTKMVGTWFLGGCTSLIIIDISPLFQNLCSDDSITIPPYFLLGCTSLTSIQHPLLLLLVNVTSVGDFFLCKCTSLEMIDDLTHFMRYVTKVGCSFMALCTSITSIDLSPFSDVTTIGVHFMYNCSSLSNVDPSPLIANMTSTLDDTFLGGSNNALTPTTRMEFMQALEERKQK